MRLSPRSREAVLSSELQPGAIFADRYRVERRIASGGMGSVYEVVHLETNRRRALKVLHANLVQSDELRERFRREARVAAEIESEHIVDVFDAGIEPATEMPFLVMELLRGEDLGHRLRKVGRLELDAALDIIAQILRGLCRAHEAGIVHRDLKPDNVFLTEQDDGTTFVKILDFGISKMRRGAGAIDKTITKQGTVLGTPFYMSPEQAQALPDVDERTDLWSTGAILYEALTGKPPHDGHSYEQVIVHICTKDPLDARVHNPGIPDKLAEFLKKALCRDRQARFQHAREMLEALGEASEGLLSSRALRISAGRTATPVSPEGTSTPNPVSERDRDVATAPTVDVSTAHPSRVGWSTSSGTTVHAGRRKLALGVSVVAVAIVLAFVFAPRQTAPNSVLEPPAPVAAPIATQAEKPAAATPGRPDEPTVRPAASLAEPMASAGDRNADPTKAGTVHTSKTNTTKDKAPPLAAKSAAPATTEPKPTATTTGVAPQLKLKEE